MKIWKILELFERQIDDDDDVKITQWMTKVDLKCDFMYILHFALIRIAQKKDRKGN